MYLSDRNPRHEVCLTPRVNSHFAALVADDEEAMRTMVAEVLRRDGYQVREAADGQELLELLQQAKLNGEPPPIVISDQRMPRCTGLEVLFWSSQEMPSVPFILLTAFGDAQIHRRGRELGAAAVLNKPIDLNQLLNVVRSIIGKAPVSYAG